ncbi:MAG TPA: rhodanese-like domain-containing protein [Candidatus Limnocylindria bacterium]
MNLTSTRMRSLLPLLVILLLAGIVAASCSPTTGVRTMSAADAVGEIESRTVIDVRTPAEVAQGMIAGAINIDIGSPDFRARIEALDRDGRYLLYCRTGNRSAQAASVMRDLGFTDVVDAGGFDALVAAGAPTGP